MLNPLKRLKNIWRLSETPDLVDEIAQRINAAPDSQLQLLKEVAPFLNNVQRIEGDGKAEFLPDMTEDEVLQYERSERAGWKDFKLPWKK